MSAIRRRNLDQPDEARSFPKMTGLAGPSQVLASAVTRGLVQGSGLRLEEAGSHQVKGFDAPLEVYRLEA